MTRTKKRTTWRFMFYQVKYFIDRERSDFYKTPTEAINRARTLRGNGHTAEVYKVEGYNG